VTSQIEIVSSVDVP